MKLLKLLAFFIASSFIFISSAFAQSDTYFRKAFTTEKECIEKTGPNCDKVGLMWYENCKDGFGAVGATCKKEGYPTPEKGYPAKMGYPAGQGYPATQGYQVK